LTDGFDHKRVLFTIQPTATRYGEKYGSAIMTEFAHQDFASRRDPAYFDVV
jgi:hypothetical protein